MQYLFYFSLDTGVNLIFFCHRQKNYLSYMKNQYLKVPANDSQILIIQFN